MPRASCLGGAAHPGAGAAGRRPVAEIAEGLMDGVRRWTSFPQDDMTLLALRHRGVESPPLKLIA